MERSSDFNFAVIGGGSGGLAAAKEASKLGAKVVMFDYVTPTVHGTKWGVGGTCVNVGCIPKKLMHYASSMSAILQNDAPTFGWKSTDGPKLIDWATCVQTIQATIKRLNFTYRTGLRAAGVTYVNAQAELAGERSLKYLDKGEPKIITADHILIAVGGHPHVPISKEAGADLAITSDDIFSLPRQPGKTLIVGGSYIALECAGFLTGMGFDTHVAIRSVPLRLFDQQCAAKITQIMEESGTTFHMKALVEKLERSSSGRINVTFTGMKEQEEFDTVLFASGRNPNTATLNLEAAHVKVASSGKIEADALDRTSTPNIYAVGDCCEGRAELTPVAIKCGEMLARRLFANETATVDHNLIPTTVFTPVEYGVVGLSEEEAEAKYGREDIEIYLQEHKSLEIEAAHRPKVERCRTDEFDVDMSLPCLVKLICVKSEDMRVIGFHFVGPNAGEITQGFALALRLGAKKRDFDSVIGIHPTDAEAFVNLSVTKASGEPFQMGGCGGGRCG